MTRRCSHCSNNGHNSRTCPSRGGGGGVKLFGVRLTDGSIMKKSASMGNLNLASLHHSSSTLAASCLNPGSPCSDSPHDPGDYLSDDQGHTSSTFVTRCGERKKGVPWTEEEHRLFLVGLQKLGRGDWRGIARNYVVSRTPTQVASHAQKHFIRQNNATRRKRRSSLFDMALNTCPDSISIPEEQVLLPPSENSQPCNGKSHPSLNLSLKSEYGPMETTSEENVEEGSETTMGSKGLTPMAQEFFPSHLQVPLSIWPSIGAPFEEVNKEETSHSHQVVKPIPVVPKEPVNVDELVGMSHLSIGETQVLREPSPLSLKLLGEPSRQSAFHTNAPVGSSPDINSGKNSAIQAV